MAVLTVFDHGKTDGEVIRIRDHRFIIGRTEGDFCIPLDGRISARHVEITHQVVGGLHRWVVKDPSDSVNRAQPTWQRSKRFVMSSGSNLWATESLTRMSATGTACLARPDG
jgi:hypothetical protein